MLLRLLTLLFLTIASAVPADVRFRDDRLTRGDAVFLQAALAYSGHYVGRLDGDWGRRSRAALADATSGDMTERRVLRSLLPLIDDLDTAGWYVFNPNRSTSMLIPDRLLDTVRGTDFIEFSTPSRDLILRYIYRARGGAAAMHDWLAAEHIGPEPFYRANTSEAFISGGRIASGQIYLRSVLRDRVWETVLVQYRPNQAARGRLIVASLTNGSLSALRIPNRGYLAAMVARAAPPEAPAPAPAPRVSSGGGASGLKGTGTGFYVNGTDIVTAEHVVSGCAWLSLADGSGLTLLASDAATDLAVLRGMRRSGSWLDLGIGAAPQLGMPVVAMGYPYSGLFDQGLSVTRGNVSALRGLNGEAHVLMLTAPIQPGNSGGPLLRSDGRVVGVISYRASDSYTIERSGTLPQNMNGATRAGPVHAILTNAGIPLPAPFGVRTDISAGLPDRFTQAVVQVRCHG